MGNFKDQLDRPLLTKLRGDFWGCCFWGTVQVEGRCHCPFYLAAQELLETQSDKSQGSWHARPLTPAQPCPSALSPTGSASITQAVPATRPSCSAPSPSPGKPTSPACAQSSWGFSWLPHWSSCSSQAPIVHVCGVTMVLMVPVPTPPPRHAQSSHRTAFVNTGGRRPGPGWGGAGGFCIRCVGPEAW